MYSRDILHQYLAGLIQPSDAICELNRIVADISNTTKLQESARARYVIGFIHRHRQYMAGKASALDICLNIRDLALILGRIKLNDNLYALIKKREEKLGFRCEINNTVSCVIKVPSWLEPPSYIFEVYSLQKNRKNESERLSIGDNTLREKTVFQNYKSLEQKVAVHTALKLPEGFTLLISQPTGGGKSLITQMLASSINGLTVVIVPTVALALDQYYAANNNLKKTSGVYCYRGEQSNNEKIAIIEAIRTQNANILFTSPEAIFKNTELYNLLGNAAKSNYLKNIVIDEAHIVPDWGVYFRPDFQIFSIALRKWRKASRDTIRTYLLSATLSDDVVDTLFKLFGTDGKNKQIRCDALRQEPRFYFYPTKLRNEQIQKTIDAIKYLPKPMVVYVLEPREAKELQGILKTEGFLNIPVFTGETKEKEREDILEGWKQQKYDVVVATSAFGIGVDKPDVRTIIHACCPENLSRFYQEVGRGGRDGLPSISLFMPYQNRYDGEGDIKRALGLVNKRVLTVKRAVIRWNSMLHSPSAIIDADECVLDTSTPASSMTEEEAEYAGNRNVAWNINLLLFLYRTGFIDLLDATYAQEKKAYFVKVKLIRLNALTNESLLTDVLTGPRENEYQAQMSGYRLMSELVAYPQRKCWGRIFKHLFPLCREVCNGCPADPEGKVSIDGIYKLRINPDIEIAPTVPNRRLSRSMGSYTEMIIRRDTVGLITKAEVAMLAEKACLNEIGVFVAAKNLIQDISTNCIVFDYEEFFFTVSHCPYLFSGGLICILTGDNYLNYTLYKNIKNLETLGYRCVIYCNENTLVMSSGRAIRECVDGYTISLDRF